MFCFARSRRSKASTASLLSLWLLFSLGLRSSGDPWERGSKAAKPTLAFRSGGRTSGRDPVARGAPGAPPPRPRPSPKAPTSVMRDYQARRPLGLRKAQRADSDGGQAKGAARAEQAPGRPCAPAGASRAPAPRPAPRGTHAALQRRPSLRAGPWRATCGHGQATLCR